MEGAALVNVWVAPQKPLPKWQMDGIQPCLVLLVDWIIALSHSNKEKTTHIGHFYTLLILIPSSQMSTLVPTEPESLQSIQNLGVESMEWPVVMSKSQPN